MGKEDHGHQKPSQAWTYVMMVHYKRKERPYQSKVDSVKYIKDQDEPGNDKSVGFVLSCVHLFK